jgi:hypothetical protein
MEYAHLPQPRRSLALPLMAAAVLGAGIATTTFALVNIEDEPVVSLPTPAEEPAAIPSDAVAGQRADGGPEEGTAQQSIAAAAAGIRYDGGPEEGTSGAVIARQSAAAPSASGAAADALRLRGEALNRSYGLGGTAAATRYDGGPEEGTRGATAAQQSGSESGPVPFGGFRP